MKWISVIWRFLLISYMKIAVDLSGYKVFIWSLSYSYTYINTHTYFKREAEKQLEVSVAPLGLFYPWLLPRLYWYLEFIVLMEPFVGNKFRLGRKIGSGSFAEIYLGLLKPLCILFALLVVYIWVLLVDLLFLQALISGQTRKLQLSLWVFCFWLNLYSGRIGSFFFWTVLVSLIGFLISCWELLINPLTLSVTYIAGIICKACIILKLCS